MNGKRTYSKDLNAKKLQNSPRKVETLYILNYCSFIIIQRISLDKVYEFRS